jgi:sugar lactone lactonase YvrE
MRFSRWMIAAALAIAVSGAALAQDWPEGTLILTGMPGAQPEGIVYDAAGSRFLTGSLSQGTIFAVDDQTGDVIPFIEDDTLNTTVGLELSPDGQTLYVTHARSDAFFNPLSAGLAELAAYDLASGEQLYRVNLGDLIERGRHFANDVTADDAGNAYVTDSFTPVIYKVDAEGNAEVLVQDERLGGGFLGLNGIVWSPAGYLLASVSGNNALVKVPLDDPAALSVVEVDGPVSIDGMILGEDGTLYAVNNGAEPQAISALVSDDDWVTARIVSNVPAMGGAATTVALRDGEPWYVNAYLRAFAAEEYQIVPARAE